MKRADLAYLGGLGFLACWIWTRDLTWARTAPDAASLLLAFPLIILLGRPWKLSSSSRFSPEAAPLVTSLLAFLLGLMTNLTLLLAVAWTGLLDGWMKARLVPNRARNRGALLALAGLAFPWINQDLPGLGGFFRVTAAWSVEVGFRGLGLRVFRDHTQLCIEGLQVEVAAPCSGVNTLQATLLLGLAMACLLLHSRLRMLQVVPFLVLLAWLTNTLRLAFLCLAGLTLGAAATQGSVHDLGGLGITVSVLWFGFFLLERSDRGPLAEVAP